MPQKYLLSAIAIIFLLGCSAPLFPAAAAAEFSAEDNDTADGMAILWQSRVAAFSDLAVDQAGNSLMIAAEEDETALNLVARRYLSDGTPAGDAVILKTDSPKQWEAPRLVLDAGTGEYVTVWSGGRRETLPFHFIYTALYAQRYDKDDAPLGTPFQITLSEDSVTDARVRMDPRGNLLVVWTCQKDSGLNLIRARKFDADGGPLSGEILVAEDTTFDQTYLFLADVGVDQEGGWVVASLDRTNTRPVTGSSALWSLRYRYDICVQRYTPEMAPLGGPEKRLSTSMSNIFQTPNLTMDKEGGFVLSWRPDGVENRYRLEGFDRYGRPTGQSSEVSYRREAYPLHYHSALCPSVANDGKGNFVAAWISKDAVYAQGFDAELTPLGDAVVLTENNSDYGFAKVAMNGNRQFCVLFTGLPVDQNTPYYLAGGTLTVSGPGQPEKETVSATIGFNPEFYLNDRPDLKAAGYTLETVKDHWDQYGLFEGRRGSRYFDVRYYLEHYSDLRDAFGTDYAAAYGHFLTFGVSEGRQGSNAFDVMSYVERYPDLEAAFGNDYQSAYRHWIMFGVAEGRQGIPDDAKGHAARFNE